MTFEPEFARSKYTGASPELNDNPGVEVKVLLITQDDPIYVKEFFDALLGAERDDITIPGVVMASPMGKQTMSNRPDVELL